MYHYSRDQEDHPTVDLTLLNFKFITDPQQSNLE